MPDRRIKYYITPPAPVPVRIYDLCAGTGAWSQPYADAGYEVVRIDIINGEDVRLLKAPGGPVRGVLAAPPCTAFAFSGNSTRRLLDEMREALAVVDACLRFITAAQPDWWALENPRGRLTQYLGSPRWQFHPAHYGDGYTKLTQLWGDFNIPQPTHPLQPEHRIEGERRHNQTLPYATRSATRAVTPPGFAKAFFEANP